MLTQQSISAIKRIEIVEAISRYIELKKKGKNYWSCCPFHKESTPSFSVSADKQIYHCFGCGASGDVISFVRGYLNTGFIGACEELAKAYNIDLEKASTENYVPMSVREQLWEDKAIMAMASTAQTYKDKQRVRLAENRILGIKNKYGLT